MSHGKRAVLLALTLAVAFAFPAASAGKKKAAPSGGSPPIDEIVRATNDSPAGPLFLGYTIEDRSAYMKINPRAWGRMSRTDRRQIMDQMAGLRTWGEADLLNAWFYVGATQLGRVKKSGGGWVFVPGDGWSDQ
jgi:hypothetical protein